MKLVLGIVVVAVAIALIPSLPYGYYPVMRWLVCGACAWLAHTSYKNGMEAWAWTWGIIAGIYNPIVPVHSTRDIWSFVNVATIVIAACYGFKSSRSNMGMHHE